MAYNPTTVQEAWDNHFAAFGKQDLDMIMKDYTDESIARVFNNVTGQTEEFKGLFGVRSMFVGLFGDLSDLSTLKAPVVTVEEDAKQVFLVWECPGCGFDTATDTFVFTGDSKKGIKIARQNIVVTKRGSVATSDGYEPKSIQEAWDNHFAAFGAQDVNKIMLDYDDNSVATVYNNVDGSNTTFKGTEGIRKMFVGLFADLKDLSTLKAPVVTVEKDAKQVFLVWSCPGCGYDTATDTFIFRNDFKISRQNIVVTKKAGEFNPPPRTETGYAPAKVQEAWDNHFAAFGAQDVEKILLDYDENSVARVHNNVTGETAQFKGLDGIRKMFVGLFADLKDLSTLSAPVVDVEEDAKQVFLVWKCPGCGYDTATDTFLFGSNLKILRQNIVVTQRTSTANGDYKPKSVQEAWDNHFAAFGAQDVNKILLDYDESSVARVHNNVTMETSEFTGVAKIREMFTGLFADLSDLSSLDAPVVTVEEAAKQVFLVWKCPGCKYETATDTFIFGDDFKIKRQNIVVTKQA